MARSTVLTAGGAVALLVLALGGCGGSGGGTYPDRQPHASATPVGSGAQLSGDIAQENAARSALIDFLSTTTPVARKVALLQDGTELAGYLRAHPSLGKSVHVVVHYARVDGSTAEYSFDLTVDGTQKQGLGGLGVAEQEHWQVTLATFCGLLTDFGHTPPSACGSVDLHVTPSATPTQRPPVPQGSAAAG